MGRSIFVGVGTAALTTAALFAACGGEGQTNSGPSTTSASGGFSAGGSETGGNGGALGGGGASQSGGMGGTGGGSGGAIGGMGGAPGTGGSNGGTAGAGGVPTNGEQGDPCTYGSDNCMPGLYCDATGCAAGTCEPVLNIAAQTPIYSPVCGCDGINYFNTTIAQSHGAAVSHADVCTSLEQVVCDTDSTPCPSGITCSVEVNNQAVCAPNLTAGVCWGAPITCGTGQPMARGCVPPGSCANKCALMRSENGWFEDVACQ